MHGNGIALIFARTETSIFFPWVWGYANALLFLKGRLNFNEAETTAQRRISGAHNAGAPSVLVAYGEQDAEALLKSGIPGAYVEQPRVLSKAMTLFSGEEL